MRGGCVRGCLWVWIVLIGWLLGAGAARAAVREADSPIFGRQTQRLLESVQEGGTDLPMSLKTSRDVYLLITAGAAYTDVRVLALPSVPPARLAQALASATAGTPLASQTVTWSADDYSAARVEASHGRLLTRSAADTVPVGALVAGLRRAGFVPHTLLRVPNYAVAAGLPHRRMHTRIFSWYDQRQVAHLGAVPVRAALSGADIALALFFLFFVGGVGLIGLLIANEMGRDQRLPLENRRRRFKAWSRSPLLVASGGFFPVMLICLRTPQALAISDLWFGSGSTATLAPFIILGPVTIMVLLFTTLWMEHRLFGPAPGVTPVPMSPEEKAVHQRMARWNMAPHLIGVLLILGTIFLPHSSPYYSLLHPFSLVFITLGTVLVSQFFRKPLSAFTRLLPDDDLTWRMRQLGLQMGVRPHEVRVEDSSRASHFATITSPRRGHVLVSRKLLGVMTPDELEFLLAHQAALMKIRGNNTASVTSIATLFPVLGFTALLLLRPIHPLNSYLFPLFMLVPLLSVFLMFPLMRLSVRQQRQRTVAADKTALEVTGNVTAAQSALTKLMQNAPALYGQTAAPTAVSAGLGERLKALGATTEGIALGPQRS